jgi:hypothetical protein
MGDTQRATNQLRFYKQAMVTKESLETLADFKAFFCNH